MDHINCNNCGERVHYDGNSECSTQIKLKEDAEALSKTKQEKPAKNPPDGGDQKLLAPALRSLVNSS